MDKRSLLAIILSLLILIGYQALISYLYPPPSEVPTQPATEPMAPPPARTPHSVEEGRSGEPIPTGPPATAQVSPPVAREITVENDVYTAIFTSQGGRLKSLRLKYYPGDTGKNSPPREMVYPGMHGELPLEVRLQGEGINITDAGIAYEVRGQDIQLHAGDHASLEFRGTTQNGTQITKVFSFSGESYGMTLEVQVSEAPPNTSALALVWFSGGDPSHNSSYYEVRGPVALVGRKFVYESASSLETGEILGPGRIRWAGYTDSYFLAAMLPPEGNNRIVSLSAVGDTIETQLAIPWAQEPVIYTLYIGPKEIDALSAVDPALDRAIDFGWFHFIARPLVSLLRFSHTVTGNYGLDIILLTVLVKLAFFPLTNKSFKSMAEMRKLQPHLERLREQYKDDRQQLNKEMMELYRRHNVNPLSGCLPMLVQLPVFIGLYQGLMYAIELRQAPFFGWIQDLSQPDRLGDLALPLIEPPGIPVLTLCMGGTMVLQQLMTPMTTVDPVQQKMMMLMPVIFTVMFVNFPSGLVLYWLVNNVLSIAQQYWYMKRFG